MRAMRNPLIVVGVALAMTCAACGDSDDKKSASEASTTSTLSTNVDELLLRADEAPGLSPSGEPLHLGSLKALVDEFHPSAAEQQRLRDHGFMSTTTVMLEGPDGDGISTVDLFASADGATSELDYLVKNKAKDAPAGVENFVPFDVPGVPTAKGWTFDKPGESKAIDIHWSQGRCVLSLGSEPPMLEQLRAGVKAIYERTRGECPIEPFSAD